MLCNRILGFVNAPALMQRAVKDCLHETVDISVYKRRRDRLYNSLTSFGYECVKPEGAFYLFPKAPIEDDAAFVGLLSEEAHPHRAWKRFWLSRLFQDRLLRGRMRL